MSASDLRRNSLQQQLRVALLAGGLGKGGAEKQLVYMARALKERGADVSVFSLATGEFYQSHLERLGVPVIWVGRRQSPALRLVELARRLRSFRPHVIHSAHFYVNLYAALLAPLCGGVVIGSLRNDVHHELEANGRWGRWLLRRPPALLANSYTARRNAEVLGIDPNRIRVLPNVIDLAGVARSASSLPTDSNGLVVLGLARLVRAKRLDRFLAAVALARKAGAPVRALVVGDGPERERLHGEARALGLLPDGVAFTGHSDDVAAQLAEGHVLLLTSDHEGFPNVLLEAMAAGLPVITTPAGDAALVVEDGATGYVVPFEAIDAMAQRLVELASSPDLRARLGVAGWERVRRNYNYADLANRLLETYESFALQQGRQEVASATAVALQGANG